MVDSAPGQPLVGLAHVWNRPDGVGGEFHALRDVAAEVAVGGVSYLVGYQEREAHHHQSYTPKT